MTFRSTASTCILLASLHLSSCAYMQTHKNIEEAARRYQGYELTPELELYKTGGKYYLATSRHEMQKHYPVIHDTIFLDSNNNPTWEKTGSQHEKVYLPISSGTATVLQRKDGYASLQVLSDEIQNNQVTALAQLPATAQRCTVNAEITGDTIIWPADSNTPEAPLSLKILSTVDRVCIDWPGTLAYNIAIPVMAPFVFFHQFLNED